MFVLTGIRDVYSKLMDQADPRVENWFMLSSPWPCLLTISIYYIFIRMGPTIMGDRKPMNLRHVLIIYNLSMVLLTGYCGMQGKRSLKLLTDDRGKVMTKADMDFLAMRAKTIGIVACCLIGYAGNTIKFLLKGWLNGYSLGCQPVDYSNSENAIWILNICWLFYISKMLELLDTVFFVLRKKFSQVTFLHVSHHCLVPFAIWCGAKFVGGGFSTFFPMLNSFVHTIMYTYYGLSACGPEFQKYLWWKKYITKIQLIQFIITIIHASQLFFIECNYPKFFVWWLATGAVFYGVLFVNFYIRAYIKSSKECASASESKKYISKNGIDGHHKTNGANKQNCSQVSNECLASNGHALVGTKEKLS